MSYIKIKFWLIYFNIVRPSSLIRYLKQRKRVYISQEYCFVIKYYTNNKGDNYSYKCIRYSENITPLLKKINSSHNRT